MAAVGASRLVVPAFALMKPGTMEGFAERVIGPTATV